MPPVIRKQFSDTVAVGAFPGVSSCNDISELDSDDEAEFDADGRHFKTAGLDLV